MNITALTGSTTAFTASSFAATSRFGTSSASGGLGDVFGAAVVSQLQSTQQKDAGLADSLATALGDSLDSLRSEFGDETARTAMALMARRLDDSEQLTEEQFSSGLLETVRLVDSNYGFAAGDGVMRQFNGALNEAINAYFDNGLNERFLAGSPSTVTDAAAAPVSVVAPDLRWEQTAQASSPAQSLLDSLQADLESATTQETATMQYGMAQYARQAGLTDPLAEAQTSTLLQSV